MSTRLDVDLKTVDTLRVWYASQVIKSAGGSWSPWRVLKSSVVEDYSFKQGNHQDLFRRCWFVRCWTSAKNTPWHASGRKGDFSDVDRLIRIHSLRQLLYVLVVGSFVGCLFPKIQNQRKCSNFLVRVAKEKGYFELFQNFLTRVHVHVCVLLLCITYLIFSTHKIVWFGAHPVRQTAKNHYHVFNITYSIWTFVRYL